MFNLISLCTILLYILYIYLLIKLLLNVKRVSLAVNDFESFILYISDFIVDHLLKLIKLLDDVLLALVKGILDLSQVDFGIKLASQVILSL